MRIHGERTGISNTAHGHGECASHVARGPPQQNRSVAGKQRAESERTGDEGEAAGAARIVSATDARALEGE